MNKFKLVFGVITAIAFIGLPLEPFIFTPHWFHNNLSAIMAVILFAWVIHPNQKIGFLGVFLILFSLPFALSKMDAMTSAIGNIYAWSILASSSLFLMYSSWAIIKHIRLTQPKSSQIS